MGHSKTVRIAALVVTHNRLSQLKVTIPRLLSEDLDHVAVVDNASTDGTGVWLAAQSDDRLVVFTLAENRGGAGGFAHGMGLLHEGYGPDWIVLMDDDARPHPNAISAFRNASSPADCVAAAVLYPDGQICEMNRPMHNPFSSLSRMLGGVARRGRGGFRIPDLAYSKSAETFEMDMASFVGCFISRRAIEICGLPDARLFLYGDDLLYTLKLKKAGLRLLFMPSVVFEHDCSTLPGRQRTYQPVWKAYYNYRNGLILYRETAGGLAWFLMALRIPMWVWRTRGYGAHKARYLRLLVAAIRDGVTGRLDRPPEGVPRYLVDRR